MRKLTTNNLKLVYRIIIAFLSVLAIWYIYDVQMKYKDQKDEVFKSYNITSGWIVDYSIVGDIRTRYLTYGYKVDSSVYQRRVVCIKNYDKCSKQIWQCGQIRFWVIYSTKHPEVSLIDLTQEIQGIENPKFPQILDDFK